MKRLPFLAREPPWSIFVPKSSEYPQSKSTSIMKGPFCYEKV